MKIPSITQEIYDAQERQKPRGHFGLSQAGHECERWLWLSFRWVVIEDFPGRILRLFRRGQIEEVALVNDLRRAGYTVTECLGDQTFIDCGCHVGGSPDGIISGLKESPKPHLLEFKTHSKKSFSDMEKKGLQESKWMHYVQMQTYMYKKGLERGLYVAVCKDDDNIYTERIKLDEDVAIKYIERAKRIALEERIPAPLTNDHAFFKCRFCAAHDFCFGEKKPEVNCRTCSHSTPKPDGTWFCERWQSTIPEDGQREGCRSHVIHPDLIHAEMKPFDEWSVYYDGILVGESGVSSQEFLDMDVNAIASAFNGRVL